MLESKKNRMEGYLYAYHISAKDFPNLTVFESMA
jgi:hypothetical protein